MSDVFSSSKGLALNVESVFDDGHNQFDSHYIFRPENG